MMTPFLTNPGGHEATVELQAGKSYYMQAYHINYGSTGFFDLAVEVPNTDNTSSWQVYQVENVTISSVVRQEVKVFSFTGQNLTGTVELGITRQDQSTFKITYEKTVNVTYGCTAAEFKSALEQFDGYKNYVLTVTRAIYDASNNTLADTTNADRVDYTVSIYLLRSSLHQSQTFSTKNFNGYTGGFTETRTQTHSDLISGNWTLSIGGTAVQVSSSPNIPYDISAYDLEYAIRNSVSGLQQMEVVRSTHYSAGYKVTWMLKYRGFLGQVNSITVTSQSLNGGDTTPTIEASTRRDYSTNIEFDPIDYRFLNTDSNSINVQVMTNGVPSVCTGTCSYTFNSYTEVTSLSRTGTTLNFALSDPTPLNFAVNTISVSVGGQACTSVSGTLTALSCTMAANTDGTAILVAGSVTPVISINTYGIAALQTGVNPLTVSLVATSLSTSTGGDNGGYLISLNG